MAPPPAAKKYWKHACMLLLTQIAVPSPITWACMCRNAEMEEATSVGARKKKAKKKDGEKEDVKKTVKKKAKKKEMSKPQTARPASSLGGGNALLAGFVVLALVAGCAWQGFPVKTGLVTWNAFWTAHPAPVVGCTWAPACLVPVVKTGIVDLNAASMANPAPSRTQDSGWLLVLVVLRALIVWGVSYVARRPGRERACGAAGHTICLNPGKGAAGEAADSRSCSFAAQKRCLSRRGRMSRKREAEWREMLQCGAHPGSHFKFNPGRFVAALNTEGGLGLV